MIHRNNWILLSLINLCIVAFLGFLLRSKILFSLPFINYEHLINAHAHFAFSGWVTLSLLTLFTKELVPSAALAIKGRLYGRLLWGIELSSLGMLVFFLLQGYGLFSILFSSLFILCTYFYGYHFIRDIMVTDKRKPSFILSIGALVSIMISSVGPFILSYIHISGSANSILYREAFYLYLHFIYNGFFTLSIFALLLDHLEKRREGLSTINTNWFANLLCASVIPSFFLSLLWEHGDIVFRALAIIGVILILCSLFFFFRILRQLHLTHRSRNTLSQLILFLLLFSFVSKSLLQIGTIFPSLGNAVFGLRPIIIGFLHLVFLGLATFYILFHYIESGLFNLKKSFSRISIITFVIAVILQEVLLMIQGLGLLFGNANPIYNRLLWVASIFLFTGAVLICIAALKNLKIAVQSYG
jgi:hypothetical protein